MAKKQPYPKIQPKLRMFANATPEVAAIRAEHSAAVRVPKKLAEDVRRKRTQSSTPDRPKGKTPDGPRLKNEAVEDLPVSLFVQLPEDPTERAKAVSELKRRAKRNRGDPPPQSDVKSQTNLATAELTARGALALDGEPWALSVELGQPLTRPTPKEEKDTAPRVPSLKERHFGDGRIDKGGAGVLIGLIDIGGFDFAHEDFVTKDGTRTRTRFECIWDQGGDLHAPPEGFSYGSLITKDHMDRAIEVAGEPGTPLPQRLEPQSQMHPGSHGTHVASIAAGNRGIARKAAIAGVVIAIPDDEGVDGRANFYDSTRIAHAVDWLLDVAGDRPVSINISLGTNGHAHDDSSAINRWIDAALTFPGRSVCVAAGNAGQDQAEYEGDIGFILGRVHCQGQIAARELVHDIEWNVIGNARDADISENELEIWYEPGDRFGVAVKPPGMEWTVQVDPGQYIENLRLEDGTYLSIYNELYNAANGDNYIAVYLSPNFDEENLIGVRPGQWLVRLVGIEVRGGHFHGWIERDDPRRLGRIGEREAWVYPSFFSERSFKDASTVSTLACGQRIVSVANLDVAGRRINPSSSQGPTRDNRHKPDIAAPGTNVMAARGFDPDQQWMAMTGTSMASPHVAGVVGLMLAANHDLTGAQVSGIIQRTAKPLPGMDFGWQAAAGAGRLDEDRCVQEARAPLRRTDLTKGKRP
jgi:subtilisin family serine protease